MKTFALAVMAAATIAAAATAPAAANGRNSYAIQYCYYFKVKAMAHASPALWDVYYACLKEHGH